MQAKHVTPDGHTYWIVREGRFPDLFGEPKTIRSRGLDGWSDDGNEAIVFGSRVEAETFGRTLAISTHAFPVGHGVPPSTLIDGDAFRRCSILDLRMLHPTAEQPANSPARK